MFVVRAKAWRFALPVAVLFLCPLVLQAQSTRSLLEDLGLRVERLEQIVQGQALLEMLQRIETLSALSREQRGELDVLRRELEILRQQQRDVTVDQERRLTALEQAFDSLRATVSVSTPAAVAITPGSEAASSAAGGVLAAEVPAAEAPNAQPAQEMGASAAETAEVLYARALASLNAGAYPASIAAFEVFLQRYTEHSLANNARYWMAQAYFLLRDYARALEFFEQVGSDLPDRGKVADAWLKRGLCEIELGRSDAARQSLETVANRFPDSAAAPLARQTLARLAESGR